MARISRKGATNDENCYRDGENFRALERQRNQLIQTVSRLRSRSCEIPARLRELKLQIQSLESGQNAARALGTLRKPYSLLLSEGLAQSIGLAREKDALEKEQ